MARSSVKDPLDKFRWIVTIDGFDSMGFTTTDAPAILINTREYPEGGDHLHPKIIVDSATYKPIALGRGVTSNLDFTKWAEGAITLDSAGAITSRRRNITIKHMDRAGNAVKIYTLFNAIPVEFHPASDFAAGDDDSYSIERLVLKYEGFTVESNKTNAITQDIIGVTKQLTRKLF